MIRCVDPAYAKQLLRAFGETASRRGSTDASPSGGRARPRNPSGRVDHRHQGLSLWKPVPRPFEVLSRASSMTRLRQTFLASCS